MVQYSPLCDTSLVAYGLYLAAVTGRHVSDLCQSGGLLDGGRYRCSGVAADDDARGLLRQVERQFEGLSESEQVAEKVATSLDGSADSADCLPVRGRNYAKNQKKYLRKKKRKDMEGPWRRVDAVRVDEVADVDSGVACDDSVKGSVPSVLKVETLVTTVEDAELEARRTLAIRRSAENRAAELRSNLLIASYMDESKVAAYEELKKQRLVEWRNESQMKSQASLEKCKTIDPGSSASQYDIKQQAKQLLDVKAQCELLSERLHYARGMFTSEQLVEYEARKPISAETDDCVWEEMQGYVENNY